MTRTLLGLVSTAILSLGGWLVGVGYSFEWLSFALGLAVFIVNLGLWTIVVRGVLEAAADAALARGQGGESDVSSEKGEAESSLGIDNGDDVKDEGTEPELPQSRRSWILVVSMVVKITFFAGGIYLCLSHWRLSPMFFVGGLIAGLMLTAAAALVTSAS